jgi:cystathionine beta-lyase/cystathionine gamma-synthase
MAATSVSIMALVKAGEHIITHSDIYGGSFGLFNEIFPRLGIKTTFVDLGDFTQLESAVQDNTKVIFLETPSNPTLRIYDIKKIAGFAHELGIKLVVDNTFATPFNQKPIDLGADVVVHSCTKYLNGHSDLMAGAIMGETDYINTCINIFRKMGANLNGFDAWLLIRGLKTFGLRMERHNQNAQLVAEFLHNHPKVENVFYPGLTNHPQHILAKEQMIGFGGVLSFELKGDRKEVDQFLNRVKLFTRAVSLGSVESLITQPVAAVHYNVPREFRLQGGITDNLIRVSVGIEEAEDIIEDLDQALS